jgi:hypothetical protein
MEQNEETKNSQGVLIRNAVKPEISKCEMIDCAFNGGNLCHALAINVGDEHQQCDTYASSQKKAGAGAIKGGVGACKVERCAFNRDMLCGAGNITIQRHEGHGDCGMFMEEPGI